MDIREKIIVELDHVVVIVNEGDHRVLDVADSEVVLFLLEGGLGELRSGNGGGDG